MLYEKPVSMVQLEAALILMHRHYEVALETKKLDTEPIEIINDWADILRAAKENLKAAGHAH